MVDDASMIRFYCTKCNKRVKAPTDYGGRKCRCQRCGAALTVPDEGRQTSVPDDSAPEGFDDLDVLPVKPGPPTPTKIIINAVPGASEVSNLYHELDTVSRQELKQDWSAVIVSGGAIVALLMAVILCAALSKVHIILGLIVAVIPFAVMTFASVALARKHHEEVEEYNAYLNRIELSFRFEGDHLQHFKGLIAALDRFSDCDVSTWKGGRIRCRSTPPLFVKANIQWRSITYQGMTIYFLPDRLLIYGQKFGFKAYSSLQVSSKSEMHQSTSVPKGASILSQTTQWQHQRVDGGPDRRFKHNYSWTTYTFLLGRLIITGSDNFNIELTVSNPDVAAAVERAISLCAKS